MHPARPRATLQFVMNSGKQIDYFFVFDPTTQEWQKTDFAALVQRDDETVTVCPCYTNGEQGKQSTWGEFLEQNHATLTKKEANSPVKFRYFDARSYDWQDTTLESLIMLNENNLTIVPVYSDGKTEKALTWQKWKNENSHLIPGFDSKLKEAEQKKQRHQEAVKKKEKEKQQEIEKQNKELSATNLLKIKSEIEQTMPQIRKFVCLATVVFWFNVFASNIAISTILFVQNGLNSTTTNLVNGFIVGILASLVFFAIIISVRNTLLNKAE